MTEYEKERIRYEQKRLWLQTIQIFVTMGIPFVLFVLDRIFK